MPAPRSPFQYAIVRVVPRVERGECFNAGIVLLCRQGYSSSLAAARLRALGLDATDVAGGIEAWIDAGLPLDPG